MTPPAAAAAAETASDDAASAGARPFAAGGPWLSHLAGALAWVAGGACAWALDGQGGPGSPALPLVLAAAVSGLWWPAPWALAACGVATLAFNWAFVAPRGSWQVSLLQDVVLLATLLAASLGVTLLMARQRRLAGRERLQARRVRQLYELSEALRAADNPAAACAAAQAVLAQAQGGPGLVALLVAAVPGAGSPGALTAGAAVAADAGVPSVEDEVLGTIDADERAGLRLCRLQGRALGPGTGRHDHQGAWTLPLRGLAAGQARAAGGGAAAAAAAAAAGLPGAGPAPGVQGAALLRLPPGAAVDAATRQQAQALCDLLGQALERLATAQAADRDRHDAQAHALRSTLLAAVSHDYRTPLATILGAASSLHEQAERLSLAQRQRLAATIVDEASQLNRLTDNALQLARLDAAPQAVRHDWESPEELVGAVLRRVRGRDPSRRVRARLVGPLPLLRCNAVLLVQLLENLIDNALKYAPAEAPVEVLCRPQGPQLLLAVRDRGPGMAPALRQRLLQPFERGDAARVAGIRGAGLGLALCQAVARAHGSQLVLRARRHGGTSVGLLLPLATMPPAPPVAEAGPEATAP